MASVPPTSALTALVALHSGATVTVSGAPAECVLFGQACKAKGRTL
jgi:hypothetical protein